MIEIKNLKKVYDSKKGTSTIAIDDISFKIINKGLVFITGPSGCGKSTLLNLLGGLDSATAGEINVGGKNICKFNDGEYDSYRNTHIGFIFQEFNILEQYNVYENIEIASELQLKKISRDRVDKLLSNLGLSGLGSRQINELSGGQKQRVAIARALIKQPKIILADEPTGNLDSKSSAEIFDILKSISKEALVIVVSHDLDAANKYGDRIIKMSDGKVIDDINLLSNEDTSIENIEFKKAHLPFKYTLKMAFSNLMHKPLKLILTLILTAASLVFMSFCINSVLFDAALFEANVMRDNNDYVYKVNKYKEKSMYDYEFLDLEEQDLTYIYKISKKELNLAYNLYDNNNLLKFELGNRAENDNYLFSDIYKYDFIELKDDRIMGDLIGAAPSSYDEVVIHKYLADYIIKYGIKDISDELYIPKNYDELVTSKKGIKLGDNTIYIVGIVNDDDSLYHNAKNNNYFESDNLSQYFKENYYDKAANIYVKGLVDKIKLNSKPEDVLNHIALNYFIRSNALIQPLNEEVLVLVDNGMLPINSLKKNEIVVSIDYLRKENFEFEEQLQQFLKENDGIYSELLLEFTKKYLIENDVIGKRRVRIAQTNELTIATIVGISLNDINYISYQFLEDYQPTLKEIKHVLIYDDDIGNLKKVFEEIPAVSFNNKKTIGYVNEISNHSEIMGVIATYFVLNKYLIIASLIFVLFSFLLSTNFIAVSISYAKKEIGILRAIGARKQDIIKIFGYETFIIGVYSWLLSLGGWYILITWLNKSLFGKLYFTLNGIITNPITLFISLAYIIVLSFSITFISISRISKVKPIEAILKK